MHDDMKDEVIMTPEVTTADLFSEMNLQHYEEYVTMENDDNFLWLK